MSERTTSEYRRLLEVRLLHHYWLDDGATVFDKIDEQKRDSRLLSYDHRSFLTVRPTTITEKVLASYKCLFRETATGFVIGAPADKKIPGGTVLEFSVVVKDSQFYAYTALTLRPKAIFEFYSELDKTAYRYKENVPVLSNLTGVTRMINGSKVLFLSRENPSPTANDQIESFILSGGALMQLTSDNPSPTTQQLGALASSLPVYLHQGDTPTITPPAGLVGVPAKGVRLSNGLEDEIFACLRLTAVRGDDDDFSFVDGEGKVKTAPPVYDVRFKNRSTYWKYVNKSTGAQVSVEANPLPLTFFGNAGTKQKPSNGLLKTEMSGNKITKLISEIYV